MVSPVIQRASCEARNATTEPTSSGWPIRLGIEDGIPDATTLWLFREKLAKASLIEKLFERFDQHLAAQGGSWRSDG